MHRKIPAVMATQHPDNARAPYWEKDGDAFVSVHEEMEEAFSAFSDLDVDEYMWDWEGKYADESVIDKMFSQYHEYFKEHQIGKDKLLTFRLPNVWEEKGYGLVRGLMVMLTSEDFARDLGFHPTPLFEVILPMTERAEQMMYVQASFHKLAKFKSETFHHQKHRNNDYINVIPLVESASSQANIYALLNEYTNLHLEFFNKKPTHIRPFLAGSDPALISGFLPSVLGSKIALSEIQRFSTAQGIPCYPMIGVGSLLFRGGLNPDSIKEFVSQYAGVKTVTLQSAFRYDYPKEAVAQAIQDLKTLLPQSQAQHVADEDKEVLLSIMRRAKRHYRQTLKALIPDMQVFFEAVPKRRERKLHIGLLAYGRNVEDLNLPRAIKFTGSFYSIGVPPEIIGTGRTLASLSDHERIVLRKYYPGLHADLHKVGRYLNKENLMLLSRKNPGWHAVTADVEAIEAMGISMGPSERQDYLHRNLTANVYLVRKNKQQLTYLIGETGKLRKSLG